MAAPPTHTAAFTHGPGRLHKAIASAARGTASAAVVANGPAARWARKRFGLGIGLGLGLGLGLSWSLGLSML